MCDALVSGGLRSAYIVMNEYDKRHGLGRPIHRGAHADRLADVLHDTCMQRVGLGLGLGSNSVSGFTLVLGRTCHIFVAFMCMCRNVIL